MKIYSLIIAALLLAGCAKAETPAQTDVQTTAQTTVTTASETTARVRSIDNVRPLGRTYDDGNVLWCGFSGTGAAFTVTGTKCTVTIAGCDNAAGMKDPPRIAIYRDGERVADELVDRMEKTYTVFEEDTEVTADIRIVKLSECAHSVCGIKSVDTDGTVAPAPARDMLIEFVGDSITCGYGVDDEVKEHHFSTSTEDCTKAYAIKTAEKLDADWSLVSLSGYGIISGYSDGKVQQKNQVIPKYYDKFGFSYSSFGGKKCDSIPWESAVHPDIVVINLGTNDASWVKTEPDRKEEFTKAYRAFIEHIREVHPDAHIICSLGIMGDQLYSCIEEAVYYYTEDTGDSKVYAFRFDPQNASDGYAADWHPTEATHEKAAEKLAGFIGQEVMSNEYSN